ncbi:hypothetical protein [Compostimonas suwonensis]|uniref:Uncharacterized protein n=1 Tax=Compostimonas suwonensis TaxID=1048394 RepID=A0A2M9C3Z6_9MICO|nr:hypothetical protein [Compostimonas suwonensis]PJJ65251.1 hypothetical protein CLV54_0280 [Compostimonas suwonensis]
MGREAVRVDIAVDGVGLPGAQLLIGGAVFGTGAARAGCIQP